MQDSLSLNVNHSDAGIDFKRLFAKAQSEFSANMKFRNWLRAKESSGSESQKAEIKEQINEAFLRASAKTDCTQCGNCCQALSIVPSSKDVKRLADGLKMEPYAFKTKYLKRDHEGDLAFKQRPCPFLKARRCTVYQYRPETCRSYPHLHGEPIPGRGWHIVENTLICPIVLETYLSLRVLHSWSEMTLQPQVK